MAWNTIFLPWKYSVKQQKYMQVDGQAIKPTQLNIKPHKWKQNLIKILPTNKLSLQWEPWRPTSAKTPYKFTRHNSSVKFKFDKVKFLKAAASLHRTAEVIWPPSTGCAEPRPDCFGKISKDRDFIQIISEQTVPVLSHPHLIKKKVFPDVQGKHYLYFILCPLPLSLGTTKNSLAPFSLLSSSRYLHTLRLPKPTLLWTKHS